MGSRLASLLRDMKLEAISRNREQRTTYEVQRDREPGDRGIARAPIIEVFSGLDRARIAALGYALDGPTASGDRFTGRVEIHKAFHVGSERLSRTLVDVLDERVAFRLLNELALPRADSMAVPIERQQEEANRLARLGMD